MERQPEHEKGSGPEAEEGTGGMTCEELAVLFGHYGRIVYGVMIVFVACWFLLDTPGHMPIETGSFI